MYYIIFISLVLIDQITKFYAIDLLKNDLPYVIIDNFLQFNYLENYGAAFGKLQDKKVFLIIVTIIVIIGIIFYLIKNKKLTTMSKISMVMIISGAIGNLIDRIKYGYVVDFIDVKFGSFYDYPVFNIADSVIVVGTILFAYLVLTDKYEY
ncbi:signal peptidase II [Dethiothermospora halolimnae]|uniref:signal peptidase II n=1 Tax=Dethiothermospora halolimnae TaxID=3114390 RepID=UPI003CCBE58B